MRILPIAALAAAAAFAAGTASAQRGQVNYFHQVASYNVQGGIAEIVSASPDGRSVAFSDASGGRVGFADLSDPRNPSQYPFVDLRPTFGTDAEPTSVSWAGDIVVAAVLTTPWSEDDPAPDVTDPNNAGALVVLDASNPAAVTVIGSIAIGFQPDSVKLVRRRGGEFVAVVCIENEPVVVDANGIVLDEDYPGFPRRGSGQFPQDVSDPGFVQVVTFDPADLNAAHVAGVRIPQARMDALGMLFTDDAQPEFVDVHGSLAAVSLQENNGIAILDIADPRNPALVNLFSSGNAPERICDLDDNDEISFSQGYPSSIGNGVDADEDGSGNPVLGGPRQPDAIAFTPDGSAIVCADEGELAYTGGRGYSVFSPRGQELYTDGGFMETIAQVFGQYPDGRSDARGIEVEGVTCARFGRRDFAFVMSERGSFMNVYDISNPAAPVLVQFLPTGISPEGVVAIPQRGLVVTADEVSGTLTIFQGTERYPADLRRPLLFSAQTPFGAISGTTQAPGGFFGIPDNALPTTIYYIQNGGAFAEVFPLLPVTVNGQQARYDGEGIVRDISGIDADPMLGGFFFASEGNGSSNPNLIVQTDILGRVLREIQLPNNIDAAADPSIGGNAVGSATGGRIRGNGFEGVTISRDGRYLYAAIQRGFSGEPASHTRIARYDLDQIRNGTAPQNGLRVGGDWDFFFYPLEAETSGDAGWIGLSEITAIGRDQFLVIERDQGIGAPAVLKTISAFDLDGLTPDTDGQPGEPSGNDTVSKVLVEDVLAEFAPFEKVEGVAIVRGDLWVSLDNDGGEVANRFVNLGRFRNPLGGR